MRNILALLILIIISGCASNSPTQDQKTPQTISDYQLELKNVISKSPDADFLKLRMAYTNTKMYAPYSLDTHSLQKKAFQKINEKKFEECLEISNDIVKLNYTNLGGQYLSMVCNFKLERNEDGKYHRYVLNGLINSIANNGDGRSVKTAYTTISTGELKTFIQMMGLEIKRQSLRNSNGKAFDVMAVKDPKTGEEFNLYFDISIQMVKGFGFLDK